MEDFDEKDGAVTVEGKHLAERLYAQDPEAALNGSGCMSAETDPSFSKGRGITQFILANPQRFLRLSSDLPEVAQDILFQYYLLGRAQNQIARSLGTKQWKVSTAISLATQLIVVSALGRRHKQKQEMMAQIASLVRSQTEQPPLKIREPKVLGKFEINLDSNEFEVCFTPETFDGSIAKAFT